MACVPGSEIEQRRGSAREAFDVVDVATGDELITPETPPRTVADRFAATGTLVGLSIPPELDRGALEAIARAHAGHAHGTCVLDLVVAHPACDAALLSLVLELGAGSSQVANTVATSGKATVEQLRVLHASDVASVREHAELALLEHELRGASPETFVEILHRYRDHETLDYAVRHRLATHPKTPRTILQELASSHDAIGELARDRLPVDDVDWSPPRTLELRQVLRDGTLGGLRVGDATDRIEATLGARQALSQRLGRRSNVRSWLYGNVTVLSTSERVEGIEIDFEGGRPTLVEAGEMAQWNLDRWRTFARDEGWTLRERPPVLQIVAEYAIIGLDEDGALHVVTLRAPLPSRTHAGE